MKSINLGTGYELPWGGGEVRVGDVLHSKLTHPVVVMVHLQTNTFIVKVIDEDVWFSLDEFMNAWKSQLSIEGNINFYQQSKQQQNDTTRH